MKTALQLAEASRDDRKKQRFWTSRPKAAKFTGAEDGMKGERPLGKHTKKQLIK